MVAVQHLLFHSSYCPCSCCPNPCVCAWKFVIVVVLLLVSILDAAEERRVETSSRCCMQSSFDTQLSLASFMFIHLHSSGYSACCFLQESSRAGNNKVKSMHAQELMQVNKEDLFTIKCTKCIIEAKKTSPSCVVSSCFFTLFIT